ncbi:hypothetical protein [Nocardioides sp. zg-1228]|uniref:hypothetical protein n=1 Tax=Nocardioides sp. zg-1228 TaxID=2763008 RepID=UPI00164271B9|nr:hypothetical protein [Nocardioides sp. zg-1228]MBC2934688.1 hypothetical protein [Nocardioides sp. zg-1228]QSF56006.1 hypothetical protein JX575_09890 [Nocardioides sp. zg-1228]
MLPGDLSPAHVLDAVPALVRSPSTYALVVAGVVGLMLVGDQPRAGWGWVAFVGFTLSVLGAISRARDGEVEVPEGAPSAAGAGGPAAG